MRWCANVDSASLCLANFEHDEGCPDRTVRPELVEGQSLVMSNEANLILTDKATYSVRKNSALPFDRLRANGSFGENLKNYLFNSFALLALLAITSVSQAGTLSIENAETWGDALYLQLNFAPVADVLEALDASVPLKFELSQRISSSILLRSLPEQTIILRYAPLLERFELISDGSIKPFRLRAELLDAFSNLQVTSQRGVTEVRLILSIGALPAPLRLPAMLDTDWWLDSGWVAVRTGDARPNDARPNDSMSNNGLPNVDATAGTEP